MKALENLIAYTKGLYKNSLDSEYYHHIGDDVTLLNAHEIDERIDGNEMIAYFNNMGYVRVTIAEALQPDYTTIAVFAKGNETVSLNIHKSHKGTMSCILTAYNKRVLTPELQDNIHVHVTIDIM